MGYDLVNWSPIVGHGDNYNIPGSKKLDGTQDNSNQTSIKVGNASNFSTIPTLAQINSSSDLNQIIGLVNNRGLNFISSFGGLFTPLSYLLPNKKIMSIDIATIQNGINVVRNLEGFGGYTFLNNNFSTQKIFGNTIADMRKALSISGTLGLFARNSYSYFRADGSVTTPKYWNTIQPFTYESLSGFEDNLVDLFFGPFPGPVGKSYSQGNLMYHYRYITRYAIPYWINLVGNLIQLNLRSGSIVQSLEPFTLNISSFSTDIGIPNLGTGFNGTFYNSSAVIGNFTVNPSSNTLLDISSAISIINNLGGKYFYLMFSSEEEFLFAGLPPTFAKLSCGYIDPHQNIAIQF